ncbi:MAG: DUF1385 domain-containing protein [Clostridiales bacterium]|nr:DUF1385 domain-containing protein [Clostridiales bacterium]
MGKIYYGGQAVMEGVMMQGPQGKAIACRKEDDTIVYNIRELRPPKERFPVLGWPVVRGCASFFFSLKSGVQDLTWSAAQIGESEEETLSTREMVLAVLMAVALTLVFFVALPVWLGTWAHPYIGDFGRSLLEGALRLTLFLLYVLIIRRLPEIKRLFAYHGAEHKTINALEAGAMLKPEIVGGYSRIHTRCGTSFILMVMVLMILIFTFVGQTNGALGRMGIKLLLMPLIAGLSYELYRLPLRYPENRLIRLLVAPGLAMQRLTTAEPDEGQLAVAIAALTHVPGFEYTEQIPEPETETVQYPVQDIILTQESGQNQVQDTVQDIVQEEEC